MSRAADRTAFSVPTVGGSRATSPCCRTRDGKPFYCDQAVRDGNCLRDAHFRGIIVPTLSGLRIVVGHSIDEIRDFDRTLVNMLCMGLT
jgi:hypothetical protein